MLKVIRGGGWVFLPLSLVAGCALPSVPVAPPMGIRVDEGVLTILSPACADDVIDRVEVYGWSSEGYSESPLWVGEDYLGDPTGPIVLNDSGNWSKSSGDYMKASGLGVEVYLGTANWGTTLEDSAEASALGSEEYLVDSTLETEESFRALPEVRAICESRAQGRSVLGE